MGIVSVVRRPCTITSITHTLVSGRGRHTITFSFFFSHAGKLFRLMQFNSHNSYGFFFFFFSFQLNSSFLMKKRRVRKRKRKEENSDFTLISNSWVNIWWKYYVQISLVQSKIECIFLLLGPFWEYFKI